MRNHGASMPIFWRVTLAFFAATTLAIPFMPVVVERGSLRVTTIFALSPQHPIGYLAIVLLLVSLVSIFSAWKAQQLAGAVAYLVGVGVLLLFNDAYTVSEADVPEPYGFITVFSLLVGFLLFSVFLIVYVTEVVKSSKFYKRRMRRKRASAAELSDTAYAKLLRVGNLFFPSFSELQYLIAVTVAFVLLVIDPSVLQGLLSAMKEDIRILVFPIAALVLVVLMFRRKTLSEEAKLWACLLYYGFFAVLAFLALIAQSKTASPVFSFAWLNLWLTRILLVLSVLRAVVTGIIFRIDHKQLNKMVAQNFRDEQYHPTSLTVVILLTVAALFGLRSYYDAPAVVATLTFTYTNAALRILAPVIFRHKDF